MAIGAIAGAGVGIAQLLASMSAQQDQRNLGYLNLFETRRRNREAERLARSSREDIFGNVMRYVPGRGFVMDMTPLQEAILNMQQKEQLAQFREDAPRARAAAERVDARAQEAGELFDERFNDYRYRRRKTEQEYISEAIREAMDARRGNTRNRGATNAIANMAIRTGNQGNLPQLLRDARQLANESTVAEDIAGAKREGRQRFLTEENARNETAFAEMGNLRAIADAIVGPDLNFSNENAALTGRADNALSTLLQANQQGTRNINDAYSTLMSAAGRTPDFSGLSSAARSLASLSRGFGSGNNVPVPRRNPFKGNRGTI